MENKILTMDEEMYDLFKKKDLEGLKTMYAKGYKVKIAQYECMDLCIGHNDLEFVKFYVEKLEKDLNDQKDYYTQTYGFAYYVKLVVEKFENIIKHGLGKSNNSEIIEYLKLKLSEVQLLKTPPPKKKKTNDFSRINEWLSKSNVNVK